MVRGRNTYLDFVKFVLIYLVILGHTIQMFGHRSELSVWFDTLFNTIYSFHMPLFIAISGYFTYFSLNKRSAFAFIKNRILSILVPVFSWAILIIVIQCIIDKNIPKDIEWFWFLLSVFIFSLMAAIFKLCHINYKLGWLIVSIVFFFISFNNRTLSWVFTLLPFFSIGFVLAMIDLKPWIIRIRKIIIVFFILSIICIHRWDWIDYIYVTPFNIEFWFINLFRLFTGCVASISFLTLVYWIYLYILKSRVPDFLLSIGKETLVLYLLQATFFHFYTAYIMPKNHFIVHNHFISVLISIVLLFLMYYIVCILKKNQIIRKLFVGSD